MYIDYCLKPVKKHHSNMQVKSKQLRVYLECTTFVRYGGLIVMLTVICQLQQRCEKVRRAIRYLDVSMSENKADFLEACYILENQSINTS